MSQAFQLGCTKVQFIGGEPQLNPDFFSLLMKAKMIGFDFVEVFSNLTHLDDDTVNYAKNHGICFATSVYSDEAAEHDAVTRVRSSHKRTIANLRRLVESGIDVRAAIIVMNQTRSSVDRTASFLRKLGVRHIRQGDVREFGRGEDVLGRSARLSGLCGHCWAGKLCIAPMAKPTPA
jgi:MoaA/NifB/PqqE/SkfB family radical SAM enzyme